MALNYTQTGVEGVKIVEGVPTQYGELLTPFFLTTLRELEHMNRDNRQALLQRRDEEQARYDRGELPQYDPATRDIRESQWKVRHQIRPDLKWRYSELVSPISIPSRVIRGFEAITKDGTNDEGSYMALFYGDNEDAEAPSLSNLLRGQRNLMLAIRKELILPNYPEIKEVPPVIYRPRGLHLPEVHVLVDDEPVSATNFDLALFYLTNWETLKANGSGPNIYFPKLEYHPEAKHLAGINGFFEGITNQPRGFIDTSLIIETAPALVNMHEFALELSDWLSAYSFGRYDLMFHMTKTFAQHPNRVFPDGREVTMETPFLVTDQKAFVDACYKRGISPQGGMEQGVPQRDPERNQQVLDAIVAGADGEIRKKMVGKWALHPVAVPLIRDRFKEALGGKPVFDDYQPQSFLPSPEELFAIPQGGNTYEDIVREAGYTHRYFTEWLQGTGAVQLDEKMHDAATAEGGRGKNWTRLRHVVTLRDTEETLDMVVMERAINEAEARTRAESGDSPELKIATQLLREALLSDDFGPHMISRAYPHLVELTKGRWD